MPGTTRGQHLLRAPRDFRDYSRQVTRVAGEPSTGVTPGSHDRNTSHIYICIIIYLEDKQGTEKNTVCLIVGGNFICVNSNSCHSKPGASSRGQHECTPGGSTSAH